MKRDKRILDFMKIKEEKRKENLSYSLFVDSSTVV